MARSILSAPYFHYEDVAYQYVERRLWPKGPVCPHCGGTERISKMKGKSTRIGTYKCYQCRKPFTVKVGTIFEASHVPMRLWLQAIFLIASSKKGISSNQLHRTLGVTLKTAWFMGHRIREAMRSGDFAPFGENGGPVEADETFIGKAKEKPKGQRAYAHMNKVFSLVDRDTRQVRSVVVDDLKIKTLLPILQANVAREARMMTDEAWHYKSLKKHYAEHGTVKHIIGEYVSAKDRTIHTNTVEGFFSIFKRGMKGVYQHCASNHLNRYMAEFDFRYNTRKALGVDDGERAEKLLQGVIGKRLTYQTTR